MTKNVLIVEDDPILADAVASLVEATLGRRAVEAREAVPRPGSERMLETLIGLPEAVALPALAERLDHLRHLHLREDLRGDWAERHREAVAVWLPFAERVHTGLAARFSHWQKAFARRL